jgi:hypothetical protein
LARVIATDERPRRKDDQRDPAGMTAVIGPRPATPGQRRKGERSHSRRRLGRDVGYPYRGLSISGTWPNASRLLSSPQLQGDYATHHDCDAYTAQKGHRIVEQQDAK